MQVLQNSENIDRLDLLKAVSMFSTLAKELSDLPESTQMQSILPIFSEVWPTLK